MRRLAFFSVILMTLVACSSGGSSGDSETSQGSSLDDADDDTTVVSDDTHGTTDDDHFDDTTDDSADDDTADYTGTRYPIVLLHGFGGWGYLGDMSNFYQVQDTLIENGFEVYEPWVSTINSMEERATELAEKIEAKYPGQKVNLIAHSQGGLDARYLITHLGWGDRVASLTTLSTPHKGTSIADIAAGLIPGFGQDIIDLILNLLGMDWDGVYQLTHEYVENVFNPETPDDPRVAYYSFHGNAEELFLLLEPTHAILQLLEGDNDGIIGCDSSTYAQDLGALPVDHFGICGQPLGMIDWDWLGFYLDYANSLRAQGF